MKPKLKIHHLLGILNSYPENSLVEIDVFVGDVEANSWMEVNEVDDDKYVNNTLHLIIYNNNDSLV